jgi:hypothetical protein
MTDRINPLTVEEIYRLSKVKGSVLMWNKPKPAAFVISMQARFIVDWIKRGMIRRNPKSKGYDT